MILGAIPGSAFLGINAPMYLYQLMSASRETYLFHHLDTEKYDIAPKQYLLHLKLEKACQLLRSTDLPVATIAGSMGFDDAMAFSKLFKKTYGCTPTHFRCAETAPL